MQNMIKINKTHITCVLARMVKFLVLLFTIHHFGQAVDFIL